MAVIIMPGHRESQGIPAGTARVKTEGVVRVAVVGAGRMGQLHARILASTKGVSKLVITDADLDQAKAVAEELAADAVPDPMDALDSVDAAVIATPAETHAVLVKAAVGRGCPVLCEKPLAESLDAAIELADYVERSGVLVRVGFQRRFDHGYRAARDAVIENRLGKLYLVRLQVTEPGRPPSPKTNLLRNTAIHDFDLVRWLSGEEVVSVYADGAQRNRSVFDPGFDPDTIVASLTLSAGALAAVTVSRLSPLGYDVRAELVGSRDHVAVGWGDRTPVRSLEVSSTVRADNTWSSWQLRFEEAYRDEVRGFLEAARGGADGGATVRDAVEAHRIAEAARISLQQRVPVTIKH
jgi:myo-inositol 2-dehydrogenase/D-chiro-inositol 1-dehydrogenase